MRRSEERFLKFLRELLSLISKLDKRELQTFRRTFEDLVISREKLNEPMQGYLFRQENDAKTQIIGGLPKVLLSEKYFPYNLDIDSFARIHLGIKIPHPNKKSRPELIGIVVTKVAEMKPKELSNFNKILNRVLKRVDRGKVDDFFLEWEKTIQNIKFE